MNDLHEQFEWLAVEIPGYTGQELYDLAARYAANQIKRADESYAFAVMLYRYGKLYSAFRSAMNSVERRGRELEKHNIAKPWLG